MANLVTPGVVVGRRLLAEATRYRVGSIGEARAKDALDAFLVNRAEALLALWEAAEEMRPHTPSWPAFQEELARLEETTE